MTRISRAAMTTSSGLVAVGGGVVTALQLIPTTQAFIAQQFSESQNLISLVGFVVLIVGVRYFVKSLIQGALVAASRNELPELTAAMLAGRTPVIDHIVKQCGAYRQVFLEAAPGCGTTAVLSCGLKEKLLNDPALRAVYVESLVPGGGHDAQSLLSNAVTRALTPAERLALDVEPDPSPALVWRTLEKFSCSLSRTPLLLIDHFDDYLRCFGQHLGCERGSAKSASSFWAQIATLLEQQKIRLLIAGVSNVSRQHRLAFTFVENSEVIALANLDRATANAILDRLFTQPEKDDWRTIKERIVADLAPRNTVPARHLALAIHGLLELDEVSEQAYAECGRLDGLCAKWIRKLCHVVAQDADWTELDVLISLAALTTEDGQRREPLTTEAAAQIASDIRSNPAWALLLQGATPLDSEKIGLIYEAVRQAGLEHAPRAIQVTSASTSAREYRFRYDFLARASRVALAEYDPVTLAIARRAEGHRLARGLSWWSTLLPPGLQLRALLARLRRPTSKAHGQERPRPAFRYGVHRGFAMLSLLRVIPYLLPAAAYALVADAGAVLPFATSIRAALDRTGLTLLRRPDSPARRASSVVDTRTRILERFRHRLHPGPWMTSGETPTELDEQPWLTGQAIAAAFSSPLLSDTDETLFWDGLKTVMDSGFLVRSGRDCLGFRNGQLSDRPFVEPTLWTAIAIAEAAGHQRIFSAHGDELRTWQAELRGCLKPYSRVRPDGVVVSLTEFPSQDPGSAASIYATSLGLLLDATELENEATKEIADEADALRDELWARVVIQEPAGKTLSLRGWRALADATGDVDDGVTLQVAYILLTSQKNLYPDKLEQQHRDALVDLVTRLLAGYEDNRTPLSTTDKVFAAPFIDQSLNRVSNEHVVRFLWYPWAIGAACALESNLASAHSRLVSKRALSRLLALRGAVISDKNATYHMSELLFTLRSFEPG